LLLSCLTSCFPSGLALAILIRLPGDHRASFLTPLCMNICVLIYQKKQINQLVLNNHVLLTELIQMRYGAFIQNVHNSIF
jgi:hypothetical protein